MTVRKSHGNRDSCKTPHQCAGRRPEVRDVPVRNDHAQHRGFHRLGPHHRPLHREGLDSGPRIGRLRHQRRRRSQRGPGWPHDHLPAAPADRLHRRPDGLRRPWRRGGRNRHHGCHCGRRHPDVHRCHDHGPAWRLDHEEDRLPLGRQDPARLRDAGEQLRRRHLGCAAGDAWLLRHLAAGAGLQHGRRKRGPVPGQQRACCRSPASSSSRPRCCS